MSSVIDSIKDIILHSLVKPCIARSKLEGEKLLSVFTLFLVLISFFGNVNASEVVFNSTGALKTFTVPSGVTAIDVKMWGAGGGGGGGGGGFSSGILGNTWRNT